MVSSGLRTFRTKALQSRKPKTTNKFWSFIQRREFLIFLALLATFFTLTRIFHKDLPVFYFDVAEHAALIVEVFSMAGSEVETLAV